MPFFQNGMRNLTLEYNGKLTSVLNQILDNPFTDSQSIAERAGVDKNELLEIYAELKNNPVYSDKITYESRATRSVSVFKDVTKIPDVLSVIDGTKKYCERLEIWLGLGCPYVCNHCFSAEFEGTDRAGYIAKRGEGQDRFRLVPHPKLRPDDKPITIEKLKQVLDESINPDKAFNVPYFLFSGGKEPFTPGTDKKVCEAVKYIKERAEHYGVKSPGVCIYTTGVGMHSSAREYVTKYVDSIRVSMDGAIAKVWEYKTHTIPDHVRHKINFKTLIENVKELVTLRDKEKSATKIRLAQLLLRVNYTEWKEMTKLAVLLGVDLLEFKRYIGWPDEVDKSEPPVRKLLEVAIAIKDMVANNTIAEVIEQAELEDDIVALICQGKSEKQVIEENLPKLTILIEDTFKTDDSGKFMPFFHQTWDWKPEGQRAQEAQVCQGRRPPTDAFSNKFPSTCLARDMWMILGPRGEIQVCTPMTHAGIVRDIVIGESRPEYIKGFVDDYDEDPLTNIYENSRNTVCNIDTRVCFYRCDHNGINVNWALQKVKKDIEWGILADQQPFDNNNDPYLKLVNRD